MSNLHSAENVYHSRIEKYGEKLTKIEKQIFLLSNIRLAVVLTSIASFYYVFNHVDQGFGVLTAIIGLALFVFFVLVHTLYKD